MLRIIKSVSCNCSLNARGRQRHRFLLCSKRRKWLVRSQPSALKHSRIHTRLVGRKVAFSFPNDDYRFVLTDSSVGYNPRHHALGNKSPTCQDEPDLGCLRCEEGFAYGDRGRNVHKRIDGCSSSQRQLSSGDSVNRTRQTLLRHPPMNTTRECWKPI
jgi:hypothetical protein